MTEILKLRQNYHQTVCQQAIFLKRGVTPSIADIGSSLSAALSKGLFDQMEHRLSLQNIKGQTAGKNFEAATKNFLEKAMKLINHLRPGKWRFSVQGNISSFEQYQHLAALTDLGGVKK